MIIIKIIILYFIQIRHTDDFPSTGTRLVFLKTCMIFYTLLFTPTDGGTIGLIYFCRTGRKLDHRQPICSLDVCYKFMNS